MCCRETSRRIPKPGWVGLGRGLMGAMASHVAQGRQAACPAVPFMWPLLWSLLPERQRYLHDPCGSCAPSIASGYVRADPTKSRPQVRPDSSSNTSS